MTDKQREEFEKRIAISDDKELVVVTYDIMGVYLEDIMNEYKSNHKEDFLKSVKKARECIGSLVSGLDMNYDISRQLLSLYLFINKSLLQMEFKREPINIQCINDIINSLRGSFATLVVNEKSSFGFGDNDDIYAGFTYSKEANLNETTFNQGF